MSDWPGGPILSCPFGRRIERSLFPEQKRRARGRRAFTLIEVLLALAIFLLALVAIAGLVDMGVDRELEAQLKVRGSRLAQAKMGEVLSGSLGSLAQVTSSSGSFDNDTDWSYQVTSELAQTTSAPPNLYTVQVQVSRDYKGHKFMFTLTQMAIDPYYMMNSMPATTTSSEGDATTSMFPTGVGSTGGTQ